MTIIILTIIIIVSSVLAAFFSGCETGMYRLSPLRLRLGVEKKRLAFVILAKLMHDSPALLISMLIGTNLAYYLTTIALTHIFLERMESEHMVELLVTIISAPFLFIFAELIPKNIFFYRADLLMPRFAPILLIFHKFFTYTGIVPLMKIFSRLFARLIGSSYLPKTPITVTRISHIKAILRDTREEAFLSTIQTDIINRLVGISNLAIRSVMTPFAKTQTININSDRQILLKKLKRSTFTRWPLYRQSQNNIIGFVNIYDCLCSDAPFTNLQDFLKPIRKIDANTPVSDAINIMQTENLKILLVTKSAPITGQKPIGIVTMKDLVEELIGELTEW